MPTFPNVQPLHFSLHLRSTCCADVTLMLSFPPHHLSAFTPYTLPPTPLAHSGFAASHSLKEASNRRSRPIANNQ